MKPKTDAGILQRITSICARQEKSPSEVLTLLKRWGIDNGKSLEILEKLRAEKFIDETRYASAYVRDKIRFEHWGLVKIKYGLKQKGIDPQVAEEALTSIDHKEYHEMIRNELIKKKSRLKGLSLECWQKLTRFGASRGYETEIMRGILEEICSKDK